MRNLTLLNIFHPRLATGVCVRAIVTNRIERCAHCLLLKQIADDAGQFPGPLKLARGFAHKVLPDLDERVGKPALGAVAVQAIALQLAMIGHVFTDDEAVLRA